MLVSGALRSRAIPTGAVVAGALPLEHHALAGHCLLTIHSARVCTFFFETKWRL